MLLRNNTQTNRKEKRISGMENNGYKKENGMLPSDNLYWLISWMKLG